MLFLTIDTTLTQCQVALFREKKSLAYESETMIHGYADALMPMIERVFEKSGKKPSDLDAIFVLSGPGSFTGIRVGLSAARALGFAAAKKTYGFSTLQVLAYQKRGAQSPFGIAIDTRRGDYYTQIFHENAREAEKPIIRDEADMLASSKNGIIWHKGETIDLEILCDLYTDRLFQEGKASPLYIRPPDAEIPKKLPDVKW